MKKRIFSALMALCLAFSISGAAFADDATAGAGQSASQTVSDTVNESNAPAEKQLEEQSSGSSPDSTPSSSEESQEEAVSSSSSSSESSSGSESSSASSGSEVTSDSASSDVSSDSSTIPESGSSSSTSTSQGESAPSGSGQDPVQGDPSAEQAGPANGMPVTEESGDVPTVQADNAQSSFVYTWGHQRDYTFRPNKWVEVSVTVNVRDTEGNPIPVSNFSLDKITPTGESDNKDNGNELDNGTTLSFTSNAVPKIDGYEYSGAVYERRGVNLGSITSLKVEDRYTYRLDYSWFYQINGEENDEIGSSPITVTLTYKQTSTTPGPEEPGTESGDFYIKDTVVSDGNFTVVQKGQDGDDALPEGYTVDWSRVVATNNEIDESDAPEDGWSDPIARERVHHDMYNLSEDGKSVNVTLDAKLAGVQDNQRVWYRAIVKDSNDTPVATLYKRVPYYIELQNGGFETPKRDNGQHDVYLNNNEEGVIWSTTDEERRIEIIRPDGEYDRWENKYTGTYGTHGINEAPEGGPTNNPYAGQVAELNATSEGTLYQDVLTVPETTLNWSLMHRARNNAAGGFYSGYDTMYVVIMSAEKAGVITNQDQVHEIIKAAQFDPEEYVILPHGQEHAIVERSITTGDYAGATVWRITDYIGGNDADPGHESWKTWTDTYEVPEGQYMSRFFFAAGATGFDYKCRNDGYPDGINPYSVGNLLDGVQFTPDALDPYPGQATIKVTKTVNGLTAEQLKDYSVSFAVKDGDTEIATIKVDDFSAPDENGNSTASGSKLITLGTNVTTKNLTITENLPSGYDDYDVTTASASGDTKGDETIRVTVSDQQTTVVTYTNTYTPKAPTTATLTLSKTFDGLTDEDVYFLLFDQYERPEGSDDPKEWDKYYDANFSFDVNFCNLAHDTDQDKSQKYMAFDTDIPDDIKMPGSAEKASNGGQFKVYAAKSLNFPTATSGNALHAALEATDNAANGAKLDYDEQTGNWTFTQTITVPVTPEDKYEDSTEYQYFYTVYELHGEVPGYAKLDPDSVAYHVDLNNGQSAWDGTGKIVRNKDESPLVNLKNEDEIDGIEAKQFARLHITGDTSISFTNYYTDSLSVQKEVTENGGNPTDSLLTDLGDKEYTVKIEPADADKLVTSSSTTKKNNRGPDWATKLSGEPVEVSRETTIAEGKTHSGEDVKFDSEGNIILKLYRGEKVTLKGIPAINYKITEITPEGKDSAFYDTTNYYLADTYFTEHYNDKVDDGPVDTQYGEGDTCSKPDKDNKGPDHWNQYGANEFYGYNDANAPAKTQDGVVSVDVKMGINNTSVDVTLTNDYEHFKTVTITKQIGGGMGVHDTAFNFTTEVERTVDSIGYTNDVKNTTVRDAKMPLNGTGSSTEVVDVTVGDSNLAGLTSTGYNLSHEDVLTISKLKKGDTLTIAETDANRNGYDTTYTINGGEKENYNTKITVTLDDETLTNIKDNIIPVVVNNDRPVVAPTGLESNHTAPYALMVTAAGVAGLALLGSMAARRRRRQE